MLRTLGTIPPEKQDELTEMIESLCRENGITWAWTDTMDNRADHSNKAVRLKRIRHFSQFASCLHEIGHLLIQQQGDLLDREYRAWEWARNWAQSRQPFDKNCYRQAVASLGAYVEKLKVTIPSDHPGLRFYEEMKEFSI